MKCKETKARTSDVCLRSIWLAFTVLLGCRGLFVFAAALEELKSIFVVLICVVVIVVWLRCCCCCHCRVFTLMRVTAGERNQPTKIDPSLPPPYARMHPRACVSAPAPQGRIRQPATPLPTKRATAGRSFRCVVVVIVGV